MEPGRPTTAPTFVDSVEAKSSSCPGWASVKQSQPADSVLKEPCVNHVENISFLIIDNPQYSLILGYPWLCTHNPHADWTSGKWSQPCHSSCMLAQTPCLFYPLLSSQPYPWCKRFTSSWRRCSARPEQNPYLLPVAHTIAPSISYQEWHHARGDYILSQVPRRK